MSFLHPEFFYFMLLPLFILFILLLTQKEAKMEFFSEEIMEKLRVGGKRLSMRGRNVLFFLSALFIIIALAQPVIKEKEIEIKAKSADVMLSLDISDSMLAQDLYPNRLRVAKAKALTFLKEMPDERVGVIAFAQDSYLVSPLSFDAGAVAFLLKNLDTNSITEKGTDFMAMLEVVARSMQEKKEKYLLILSDGGDQESFDSEIAYAKEQGIKIFVLALASQKGAPIKLKDGEFVKFKGEIIISKRNDAIASLATQTGGAYIQGTLSDEDIEAMIQEISAVAHKEELKSKKIQQYIQLFYYPLGLALFLLLLATSSMSKREQVQIPFVFLLTLFVLKPLDSHAGVLDFMDLQKAKNAYENGEYKEASKIYGAYAYDHKSAEAHYNAANAFYKAGEYTNALEHYEKANFDTKEMQAKKYANMGNSYAKNQDLQKAIEMYKDSLKLQQDKEVEENLEAIKKLLDEQQKQEQKQDPDQNKVQQDQQEQQNDTNDQKGDSQQEGDTKQSQKQDQQTQKQEDSQEKNKQKNNESQEQENSSQDESGQQENKEEQKAQAKAKSKEESSQDENKTQERQASSIQELSAKDQEMRLNQMSDAEQAKWLELLSKESHSFIYRLSDKDQEHNNDEKPW